MTTEKIGMEQFMDSALAMIADLEMTHGVSFNPKESERLQITLGEIAQRAWWGTKQGKKYLTKPTKESYEIKK